MGFHCYAMSASPSALFSLDVRSVIGLGFHSLLSGSSQEMS